MKKALLFLLGLFVVWNEKTFAQVVVNEYSCANVSFSADALGGFSDWIELYNNGAASVNLTGYHLSDSKGNILKWAFPAASTIPANGFLLIRASGANTVIGTEIHTSFKLTQCANEEIVFSDASGVILDSFTITRNQANHSRGRTTDGASTWSVFLVPTPGAANASPFKEYEPLVNFSIAPGFYSGAQNIALSCSDATALIRYTTDGSSPSTLSTIYSGPIAVPATTVIKARAWCTTDPQVPPSFIEPNTYFINDYRHIPVVSVSSLSLYSLLQASGWATTDEVSVEFFDSTGQFQWQQVGDGGKHGNDSWAYPQRGFDFVCNDEYGYNDAIKYKLFPTVTKRKSFDRVIFKAAASDNYPFGPSVSCHTRDAFVQDFAQKRHLDLDCRSYLPCAMFVNGSYYGLYEIREKVNDKDYTDYYYKQGENDIDFLQFWGGMNITYGSDTAWVNTYNFAMANSMTNPGAYQYVKDRVDFSSMIDNAIYNTYIVNSDWINWNTMWWRGRNPAGKKLKWRYCLWDEDNTYNLGQNFTGWPTTSANADPCDLDNNWGNINTPPMANEGHIALLNKLLQNPEFKSMYINRYADLINRDLNCDTVSLYYQKQIAIINLEIQKQIARWGGTYPAWQNNVTLMQNFINTRCTYIDTALTGCYSLTGPHPITVLVDPIGAGTIGVSTLNPLPYYPWTGKYFGVTTLPFIAKATSSKCVFDHWELKHHVPTSTSKDTMSIYISQPDTVIAHFTCIVPPPPVPGPKDTAVLLPNAFSPNGDGVNDRIRLLGNNLTKVDWRIYNRWGQLVFSAQDVASAKQGWDGTFNNVLQVSDAYSYYLSYEKTNGTTNTISGTIALIR